MIYSVYLSIAMSYDKVPVYGSSRVLELDHADEHAPVHAADLR